MLEIVRGTIEKNKMFSRGDGVVAGLSGGADSVALLYALLELRPEFGLEIFAAHVNHNLRAGEAARDEKFVRGLCGRLGVPLEVYNADVRGLAGEKAVGIEEAGRNLRYALLEEARLFFGAQKIAVGHNRDDNAETVVMNLCRGAGLTGLCGIRPVNGMVTRPLLEVSRETIENFLGGAEYITDTSNLSNEYTRNRVRNIVMPILEKNVNTQAKATIARNAERLREDEEFLENAARDAFANCAEQGGVNISKLAALPKALAGRVVRIAIERTAGNLTGITSVHISSVLELAAGRTGRKVHIPGLAAEREYTRIVFTKKYSAPAYGIAEPAPYLFRGQARDEDAVPEGFCYNLEFGTPVYVKEIDKTVLLSNTPAPAGGEKGGESSSDACAEMEKPIPYCTKAFECDKVLSALVLRTRRPGDIITLGGSGGMFTKKLQDYFTDAKIPVRLRGEIPLIAAEGEILWVMDENSRANLKYRPGNGGRVFWLTLWEGNNV